MEPMQTEQPDDKRSGPSDLRAGIREFLLDPENKVLLFEIDYHLQTCNVDWPSFAILFSHHTGSVIQEAEALEDMPIPGDHFASAVASMKQFIEKFSAWRSPRVDEPAVGADQSSRPDSIWDDVDDTIIFAGAEIKAGMGR